MRKVILFLLVFTHIVSASHLRRIQEAGQYAATQEEAQPKIMVTSAEGINRDLLNAAINNDMGQVDKLLGEEERFRDRDDFDKTLKHLIQSKDVDLLQKVLNSKSSVRLAQSHADMFDPHFMLAAKLNNDQAAQKIFNKKQPSLVTLKNALRHSVTYNNDKILELMVGIAISAFRVGRMDFYTGIIDKLPLQAVQLYLKKAVQSKESIILGTFRKVLYNCLDAGRINLAITILNGLPEENFNYEILDE